jgi:hypothetical protein
MSFIFLGLIVLAAVVFVVYLIAILLEVYSDRKSHTE